MANTVLTPYMNLPNPIVGTDPGPDYATNIYNSLVIVDAHNHTGAPQGQQLGANALNIQSSLTLNNNALIDSQYIQFSQMPVSLPPSSSVYSDAHGNMYWSYQGTSAVQITSGTSVVGAPGTIDGLVSPAAANYNPGTMTFTFQSNTTSSISANIDAGTYFFRNLSPNSTFAISLAAPSFLSANYALVLPLPSSNPQSVLMTLSNAGNMGTTTYDSIGQSMTSIGADAIAVAMDSTGTTSIANTITAANANTIIQKVTSSNSTASNAIIADVTSSNSTASNAIIADVTSSNSTASNAIIGASTIGVATNTGNLLRVVTGLVSGGNSGSGSGFTWTASGGVTTVSYSAGISTNPAVIVTPLSGASSGSSIGFIIPEITTNNNETSFTVKFAFVSNSPPITQITTNTTAFSFIVLGN